MAHKHKINYTLELNPDDPYLLNSYAALKLEKSENEEAQRLFKRSIDLNPQYPNSFAGLAILQHRQGESQSALETLDSLFSQQLSPDIRSVHVYERARAMYLQLSKELAENSYDPLMEFISDRCKSIEKVTGFPVELIEDSELKGVTAKTQLAWKHNRTEHRVIYQPNLPSVVPHLLAHELEHISLEFEARSEGKNKLFVTTNETIEKALQSLGDDRYKLREVALPNDEVNRLSLEWVSGLANQLFNCPLDMVIENRLYQKYPQLRPSQFLSLYQTQQENSAVLSSKDIRKLTPRKIYQANVAMNASYAQFADWLYKGNTEYTKPYKMSNVFATGDKLFHVWLDMHKGIGPGDEYALVGKFAEILKLQEWFEFRDDVPMKENPQGTTNPELLKTKEPATVMYLVSALERFGHMSPDEIQKVAFEIGLLGTAGIDYTKADRRYSLKSIPAEQFSGLQLLCLMYVGFKKIDPTLDTRLDFKDAYEMALKLFKP
jgi:tetratricopeptide (TPR) repeat protein